MDKFATQRRATRPMPDVVDINSAYYGTNVDLSVEQLKQLSFFGRRADQMVYQDPGKYLD